jgi:hypothetical protein
LSSLQQGRCVLRVLCVAAIAALGMALPIAAAGQDFGVMNSAETINKGNYTAIRRCIWCRGSSTRSIRRSTSSPSSGSGSMTTRRTISASVSRTTLARVDAFDTAGSLTAAARCVALNRRSSWMAAVALILAGSTLSGQTVITAPQNKYTPAEDVLRLQPAVRAFGRRPTTRARPWAGASGFGRLWSTGRRARIRTNVLRCSRC